MHKIENLQEIRHGKQNFQITKKTARIKFRDMEEI